MPARTASRVLLPLLILWQLMASVGAHPLIMAAPDAGATVAAQPEADPCPHAGHGDVMGMQIPEQTVLMHSGHDSSCSSLCKCPCAGTPALACSLPIMPAAAPDVVLSLPVPITWHAPSLAHPLRPPIR